MASNISADTCLAPHVNDVFAVGQTAITQIYTLSDTLRNLGIKQVELDELTYQDATLLASFLKNYADDGDARRDTDILRKRVSALADAAGDGSYNQYEETAKRAAAVLESATDTTAVMSARHTLDHLSSGFQMLNLLQRNLSASKSQLSASGSSKQGKKGIQKKGSSSAAAVQPRLQGAKGNFSDILNRTETVLGASLDQTSKAISNIANTLDWGDDDLPAAWEAISTRGTNDVESSKDLPLLSLEAAITRQTYHLADKVGQAVLPDLWSPVPQREASTDIDDLQRLTNTCIDNVSSYLFGDVTGFLPIVGDLSEDIKIAALGGKMDRFLRDLPSADNRSLKEDWMARTIEERCEPMLKQAGTYADQMYTVKLAERSQNKSLVSSADLVEDYQHPQKRLPGPMPTVDYDMILASPNDSTDIYRIVDEARKRLSQLDYRSALDGQKRFDFNSFTETLLDLEYVKSRIMQGYDDLANNISKYNTESVGKLMRDEQELVNTQREIYKDVRAKIYVHKVMLDAVAKRAGVSASSTLAKATSDVVESDYLWTDYIFNTILGWDEKDPRRKANCEQSADRSYVDYQKSKSRAIQEMGTWHGRHTRRLKKAKQKARKNEARDTQDSAELEQADEDTIVQLQGMANHGH
jgi:hypothetical protein